MTITIDGPKALKLLRGAVKLKGEDYIDLNAGDGNGCKYVVGGAPACIVGHAIAKVDVNLIPLIEIWEREESSDNHYDPDTDEFRPPTLEEGNPGDLDSGALMQSIEVSNVGIKFSDDAYNVFAAAQRVQDSGKTWGEALAKAKEVPFSGH